MPNIKPEFLSLAICETVIEDKRTGNKTVVNIFDRISAPRFPLLFPRLTVFAALSGLHGAALSENPRPPGCKKLEGHDNLRRVRSGDYRIICSVFDDVLLVLIVKIGNRKDVYG
jgi:mRNA interferase RelE/StbE